MRRPLGELWNPRLMNYADARNTMVCVNCVECGQLLRTEDVQKPKPVAPQEWEHRDVTNDIHPTHPHKCKCGQLWWHVGINIDDCHITRENPMPGCSHCSKSSTLTFRGKPIHNHQCECGKEELHKGKLEDCPVTSENPMTICRSCTVINPTTSVGQSYSIAQVAVDLGYHLEREAVEKYKEEINGYKFAGHCNGNMGLCQEAAGHGCACLCTLCNEAKKKGRE